MKTIFFINEDTVPWKGLALFVNLLIETRSDHIEKSVKIRAILYFLDKVCYLLNRKIDGSG